MDTSLYWIVGAFVVSAVVLTLLLAHLVGSNQRRQIRKRLGLPINGSLTEQQMAAFMGFENTDMKLRRTFPKMSDTQRQAMARDILRDKGVLPKPKKRA